MLLSAGKDGGIGGRLGLAPFVVKASPGGYVALRMVLAWGPAMDLAVRTTASPAAIWTIVVVAVVCLAFWLAMVMVYANRPDPRNRRVAELPGPVLGGIHLAAGGRSVSPTRDAPAMFDDETSEQGLAAPDAAQPQVPVQRAARAPAEPIPAQRPASGGPEPASTGQANVVDGTSTT